MKVRVEMTSSIVHELRWIDLDVCFDPETGQISELSYNGHALPIDFLSDRQRESLSRRLCASTAARNSRA